MSFQCRPVLISVNILERSNNYFKGVYAHTKKMILCTKDKGKINMNTVYYQK